MSSTKSISDGPRPGRTGLMGAAGPRSEPEDVVHRVEARRGSGDEPRRPEGPGREGVTAVGAMGQLEPLADRAEDDRMVSDDVPSPKRVDADLLRRPLSTAPDVGYK